MKDDKELTSGELAKAIALLKGWSGLLAVSRRGAIKECLDGLDCSLGMSIILGLRDECEVRIVYDKNYVYMYDGKGRLFSAKFTDKSQINRAVLECILESVK